MFPPHVIALACVYLAALLNSFECPPTPAQDPENQRSSAEVCAILGNNGTWETTYAAHVEDLEGPYPILPAVNSLTPLQRWFTLYLTSSKARLETLRALKQPPQPPQVLPQAIHNSQTLITPDCLLTLHKRLLSLTQALPSYVSRSFYAKENTKLATESH